MGRGRPLGWGEVDDDESVRAVHAAVDRGSDDGPQVPKVTWEEYRRG